VWREFSCNPDEYDQLDARVQRWLEIESAVRERQAEMSGGGER